MSVKAMRKLFDSKSEAENNGRSKSPLAGALNKLRGKGDRKEAIISTPNPPPAPISQDSTSTMYWLDQQDHTGSARGWAPFANNPGVYPVYRNVLQYGASSDGTGDQSTSLQNALNVEGLNAMAVSLGIAIIKV